VTIDEPEIPRRAEGGALIGGDFPVLIREHVPLAPMTTLGVGGTARFFVDAEDEPTARSALEWSRANGVVPTILGGGSNALVSDRGVDGLVLRVRIRGVRETGGGRDDATVAVEIGAGESLDDVVLCSVRAGQAGIECLSGIPGYVGATPIQNVGAYGQEIGETIISVRALHRTTLELRNFDNAACAFSYRSSVFKGRLRHQYIVVSVSLALRPGGFPAVKYPELSRHLSSSGGDPASLEDVRRSVLFIRRSKSMVLDASDPNRRSAGSFFVNPVVTKERAAEIEQAVEKLGDSMPRFAAGEKVKLSAAWLIEHSGWHKGKSEGPVGISTRHALAIVNRGGATAAQIVEFAARVRDSVEARFGVALTVEPVLIGFGDGEASALLDVVPPP
jgi:UDP-N-acetylmuramate dehydrogenase